MRYAKEEACNSSLPAVGTIPDENQVVATFYGYPGQSVMVDLPPGTFRWRWISQQKPASEWSDWFNVPY